MPKPVDACLTCHGVGETVTESGAETCPDCFGEGNVLSRGTKLEWRLRAIERAYRDSGRETESDVLWLVHELRTSRDVLLRILARCQDAEETNGLARDVKYEANEALGLYDPSPS
jgi:hypothetical protein